MYTQSMLMMRFLSSFSTNAACELYVLWHNGYSFCMDGAQVCIFKETNEIGLGSFLKGHDSTGLESEICLKILSNFTNQTLEGQLSEQEFCRFLVSSNFSKSHSSRPISVWLFNSTSGWSGFSCSFGCQLLPWRLSSS